MKRVVQGADLNKPPLNGIYNSVLDNIDQFANSTCSIVVWYNKYVI